MDLGQIIIFFAIVAVYAFALVQSILYIAIDSEDCLPNKLDKIFLGTTYLLGTFFCLVSINLIYRMFL